MLTVTQAFWEMPYFTLQCPFCRSSEVLSWPPFPACVIVSRFISVSLRASSLGGGGGGGGWRLCTGIYLCSFLPPHSHPAPQKPQPKSTHLSQRNIYPLGRPTFFEGLSECFQGQAGISRVILN